MSWDTSPEPPGSVVCLCDDGYRPEGAACVPAEGAAPTFLSFGTNITTMNDDDEVTFVAVLTDPDGIDDLIGGQLEDTSSGASYGAFITSGQEGAYTLTLDWGQIVEVSDLHAVGSGTKTFRARFFDEAGNTATSEATITLSCEAETACHGVCTDVVGTSCAQHCASLGLTCTAGWFVNSECQASYPGLPALQGVGCQGCTYNSGNSYWRDVFDECGVVATIPEIDCLDWIQRCRCTQ